MFIATKASCLKHIPILNSPFHMQYHFIFVFWPVNCIRFYVFMQPPHEREKKEHIFSLGRNGSISIVIILSVFSYSQVKHSIKSIPFELMLSQMLRYLLQFHFLLQFIQQCNGNRSGWQASGIFFIGLFNSQLLAWIYGFIICIIIITIVIVKELRFSLP